MTISKLGSPDNLNSDKNVRNDDVVEVKKLLVTLSRIVPLRAFYRKFKSNLDIFFRISAFFGNFTEQYNYAQLAGV